MANEIMTAARDIIHEAHTMIARADRNDEIGRAHRFVAAAIAAVPDCTARTHLHRAAALLLSAADATTDAAARRGYLARARTASADAYRSTF